MLMEDSPFQNILHTNAVPSDADCQRIQDFLTEPQRELANLTDEISRMQNLIDELTEKRAALDNFINAHLAMVSPARRLPDDIVRAIFIACLPSHRNPAITSKESPLLLCQICSTWRLLALSTPRLWASMHVVLPTQPMLQILADLVTSWLELSGALPLSVSVVLSRTWMQEDNHNALPLLTRLIGFSRRWQHMQFEFWDHRTFGAFKTLRPDDVPMLQSVKVQGIQQRSLWVTTDLDDDPDPVESYGFLSFLNTPDLRSVSIPGGRDMHTLPLSWAHLRSLAVGQTTGAISCESAVAILRQCHALEKFVVTLDHKHSTPYAQDLISLPHLRHLSVCAHRSYSATAFFSLLFLSNLRSLDYVQHSMIGNSFPFSPLLAWMGTLERFSLHLSMGLPDSAMLPALLATLPTLQHFQLTINPQPHPVGGLIEQEFVDQFTPNPSGPDSVLCPLLTSLELSSLNEGVSDESLLRLVRARAEAGSLGVAPLSRFSCAAAREMEVDILPLLQQEISTGLVVSLKYTPRFKHSYSPREGAD
ncbi:hypothetical protein FB451DRAFT_1534559 [Mycena latifolia]|nr:hypothetical protein FB451DRAFT_1534559 [Mycena latifolia]